MKKKMKKWLSCMMAVAMVMSTVNLPTDILASDFDDGVEISVEDENEDAPEVVDSEEALNEKDGDSLELDDNEFLEENIKAEEAENNTFSEFTDGTDFSDGEDLDISETQAVGNNEGFTPRTTAPGKSKYYYSDNPFQKNGYGMWDKNGNEQGNCTAYAWGRAYEILGTQPKLGRNNAGSWWNYNKNNKFYEYGSAPKIGAVAVWDKYNNDTGHVAVVESIDGNNVTISESHWKSTFFDTRTIRADSSNYLTKMRFLGYIYVYNGNTNIPDPSISGTYWGSTTDSTFRPVISISNPETVQNVRFAVWTTGDQSDLRWYDARFNGEKEYFQDINFSDFGNKIYICHVYVYGKNGSTQSVEMDRLDMTDYPQPDISGTYWGSITDSTFRPVVSISNPEAVKNVRFAVWTTGDQSDLKWYDARFNGVKEYFQDINFSDFNNKRYICHVYVYGKNGSTQSVEMDRLDLNNYPKPDIKGVYWGSVTDSTFRPVIVITNPESIENVRFAIWTTSDQRDLQWYDANYNGLNEYFKDV